LNCGSRKKWSLPMMPGLRRAFDAVSFSEVVRAAYAKRISLSATGFYRTPGLHWDPASGKGSPFYYFAFGAAVSEVEVCVYTGVHRAAAGGHLARRRRIAECGNRSWSDRGRLRPGHGLADLRGTALERCKARC
jgi:hypothetical protein